MQYGNGFWTQKQKKSPFCLNRTMQYGNEVEEEGEKYV